MYKVPHAAVQLLGKSRRMKDVVWCEELDNFGCVPVEDGYRGRELVTFKGWGMRKGIVEDAC